MSLSNTPVKSPRRDSSFTGKAQFRSKFSVSYEALLSGDLPWLNTPGSQSSSLSATPIGSSISNQGSSYFSPSGKKPSAPRSRFFADLLCLKVEPSTIASLFGKISARQLTDDDETGKGARIRDNVGSLWRECLRIWQDVLYPADQGFNQLNSSDEIRRANAVDTLLELSRCILSKNFVHSSSSLDLIWIFAGGIDEADDVFEDLVSAIDQGLRGELDNANHQRRTIRSSRLASSPDPDADLTIQHNAGRGRQSELPSLSELLFHRRKAIHLAIIWLSFTSTTNLSAYFLRRDLFVSVSSLLNTIQAIVQSAQKVQTDHGGLADEDIELMRSTIRDSNLLIGLLAGLGQSSASGTGLSRGFRAMEATTSPYFRRLCDWVDGGSMNLLRDAGTFDLDLAWRSFLQDPEGQQSSNGIGSGGVAGIAASLGAVTESIKKIGFSAEPTVDPSLPPAPTCILLPVYLLCRANQVFVEIIMKEEAGVQNALQGQDQPSAKTSFVSALITLSSYLASHGSLNERSKSYSKLSLLISLSLLGSPAGITALLMSERPADVAATNLCSQRSAPLPVRSNAPVEQQQGFLGTFFSQFSALQDPGKTQTSSRKRLLPFIVDTCVQYMRHNLRKKLDMSGYLLCLHILHLSIETCADRRVQLEYSEWPEVWATITSTATFLVGRHAELQGVEINKLGQALLSTLGLALLESDRFLVSRHDVNILVYEIVRSADTLKRLAIICAGGGSAKTTNGNTSQPSQRALASAIPMWRLIDMTLNSFDEKLREWGEKKGGRGAFGGLSFSVTALASSYFGGRSTGSNSPLAGHETPTSRTSSERGSRPSSSAGNYTPTSTHKRLPDIQSVLALTSSLDMEQIIHMYNIESEGGSNNSTRFSQQHRRGMLIDTEWLERAESQSLTEAFRCASEDMRTIISST